MDITGQDACEVCLVETEEIMEKGSVDMKQRKSGDDIIIIYRWCLIPRA